MFTQGHCIIHKKNSKRLKMAKHDENTSRADIKRESLIRPKTDKL